MKISVITLFPKMIECFINKSIIKRAQEKKIIEIEFINPRSFASDKYGTVDDKPYGGGAGMILKVDVLYKALNSITPIPNKNKKRKIILTSPRGKIFNQQIAKEYSSLNQLIIITGHYEGVDERINKFIDEEISIGDFILTGGEIAAASIIDSITRLIPTVINKNSPKEESFFTVEVDKLISIIGKNEILTNLKKKNIKKVKLLEYPQYTRPAKFKNYSVPKVLLSGNHKKIYEWRLKQAFKKTLEQRKDLLKLQ